MSSISAVAIFAIITALPVASAGLRSPFGTLGI